MIGKLVLSAFIRIVAIWFYLGFRYGPVVMFMIGLAWIAAEAGILFLVLAPDSFWTPQ